MEEMEEMEELVQVGGKTEGYSELRKRRISMTAFQYKLFTMNLFW